MSEAPLCPRGGDRRRRPLAPGPGPDRNGSLTSFSEAVILTKEEAELVNEIQSSSSRPAYGYHRRRLADGEQCVAHRPKVLIQAELWSTCASNSCQHNSRLSDCAAPTDWLCPHWAVELPPGADLIIAPGEYRQQAKKGQTGLVPHDLTWFFF